MNSATELRTVLRVFDERRPEAPLRELTDGDDIARELAAVGVRFERWTADKTLARDADHAAILDAYRSSVERVQHAGGYGTVDVLRLEAGTPNTEPVRKKFLDEHSHSEDEVRFFVEGSGAFYLRLGGNVYQAVCVRGDLISVPAGTRHWFDMGPDPEFTAIRWFNNQSGWVPQFTGDSIAARFPKYE
ncbi:MAG: acireductone dioxygenase [Candidatus Velthaea sp.]